MNFVQYVYDLLVLVLKKDSLKLDTGLKRLNEIHNIGWSLLDGIVILNLDLFQQIVYVLLESGIIMDEPEGVYMLELAEMALESLAEDYPDLDLVDEDYEPIEVEITTGSE